MENKQVEGIRRQILLPMIITLVISLITVYSFLIYYNEKNIIESSVIYAKSNIKQYITLKEYYTQRIIGLVQEKSNVEVDIFGQNKPNTIPLPFTMIHDLSDIFQKEDSFIKLKLYSNYPFPSRKHRVLDSFEKESLIFLESNPTKTFFKRELYNNKDSVRVAIGDTFSDNTCVSCHNALPNSPKIDWKLNDVGGALEIIVPIETIVSNNKANTIQISVMVFILLVILITIIYFYIDKKILNSIRQISSFVNKIKNGDLDENLEINHNNELETLSTDINSMKHCLKDSMLEFSHEIKKRKEAEDNANNKSIHLEKEIIIKKSELKNREDQLIKAFIQLKTTQRDLMESQRMATIGELVGIITHEVSTPLGTSITSSSFTEYITNELEILFESDELSEDDLRDYLKKVKENSEMTIQSLNRVVNLLQSFKHIAIDQTLEDKREFMLKEYIDEILLSLGSKIKKYKHKIKVDIDENTKINSYPGYFYQIITNFINNSYLHGFEGIEEGTITISANILGDKLELTYCDNGTGIDRDIKEQIFEQYFTTKKGNGGTGLGLSIIRDIVTNKLQGTIKLESEINRGIKFIILIPKDIDKE